MVAERSIDWFSLKSSRRKISYSLSASVFAMTVAAVVIESNGSKNPPLPFGLPLDFTKNAEFWKEEISAEVISISLSELMYFPELSHEFVSRFG